MHELLALTQRHLRTTLRSRGARVAAATFLLTAGAAPLLVGPGAEGASLLLLVLLLVIVLFVTGFAAGAGTVLPEDRVAGREAWLAALAPPGWKRRLSVVLAGWLLVAGLGLAAGAVAGVVVRIAQPTVDLRIAHALPLAGTPLLGGGAPVVIALPPAGAGLREIEIDVRPLFAGYEEAPVDRVEVLWSTGAAQGRVPASVRGPVRILPPEGAGRIELALLTPRVRLRLVAARRLGPARATIPTLAWAGLLLGLFAGAVVPVGVLVSRATSGQTAAAAAFSVLLLGTVKGGLLDLAARLAPTGLTSVVPALLGAFAHLAPNVRLLELLAETSAQRAPALGVLATAGPTLLYTVLVAALACVPPPAWWAREVEA